LGRVVADAATVVGEDEAEAKTAGHMKTKPRAKTDSKTDTETDTPGATASPAAGPARAPVTVAAHPQPVQIRITSSPLGAVVRTKKQVLGRTPLAVHFNPGNVYELTFVKSGYVTNTRRVTVSKRKPQSISVAMKKVPPPRHSFFLRGR